MPILSPVAPAGDKRRQIAPFVALAVIVFLVVFWRLGAPTFWNPDEAHYAETSRELTDGAAQTNFWRAALYAASCAIPVFAWCRGLPTMLRPVASLATGTEARNISPITWSWPVVVAAAAIAGFTRIILEERIMAGPHGPEIIELKRKRYSGQRRRGLLRYVPKFVRRLASTLFLLLIFGGTFSSWADLLVTGLLVGTAEREEV